MPLSFDYKCKDGSYVRNCLIQFRQEGAPSAMFEIAADGASMITRLDRYAIIPIESYEAIISLAENAKDFCEKFLSSKVTGP